MEKGLLTVIGIFGCEIRAKSKLALKRWSSSKQTVAYSSDLMTARLQICTYFIT